MDRREDLERDTHQAQEEQRAQTPTIRLGALATRGHLAGRGDRNLEDQAGRGVGGVAGRRAGAEAGWPTFSLLQDSRMRKYRRPRQLGTL